MTTTNLRLCAHAGMVFAILLGIGGFGITGWLPPPSPTMSAAEVATMFNDNRTMIRIGVTLVGLASVFWWPFSAAIAMQMKGIEGESHPLTYTQMASATGTVLGVLLPAYLWLAGAYRPELPADTLRLFNDFAWLVIVGLFPPALIQCSALGLCILQDRNPIKRYPRWVGYMNFWAAILFLPGALLPFFHTGPFTWRGLISFWMVGTVFFTWIILLWWTTLKAIDVSAKLGQSK